MGSRRGRGEGGVHHRSDGLWVGQIDLGWKDGKRKRKAVYGKTRAEAVRKLREKEALIAQGVTPASELLTVEDYLEDWLTNRIPGTITVRTEALYRRAVHSYINPTLGKLKLIKLRPSDVSLMLQDLERRGYSPATQRMARSTLRRALRIAEQDGILGRNVAAIAEGPKLNQREGRTLTPEQAKVFLEAVKGDRLEAAYVLTLALGLRRGEVLGLKWEDLSFGEETVSLSVRRQLIRDRNGISLTELKTKGSRRVLHLSEPLVEAVVRHKAFQEAEAYTRSKTWHNDHDLMFTSTIGTPIDPEWFGRTVPKFTVEAGLGHWSIHELRHSCASLLMAMEVPLEVISDQLGHASIRVTSDVYGHLLPGSKAKAAAAMESVLFGPSTEVRPPRSTTLETSLETIEAEEAENNLSHPLSPAGSVGRPGLDPGTLGLKVPCSSR